MLGNYQHVPNARIANKSTTLVFVGLYFLLLAFFIYLNSISEPAEERIRSVIGSIDIAFKGKQTLPQDTAEIRFKADKLGNAVFHAQLKQVYESAIPLIKSEESKKGDQLRFRIPINQLFSGKSAEIRDTRDQLFADASRVLIKRSSVVPTDLEITLDLKDGLPRSDDLNRNISVLRLQKLVTNFVDQGVPARNVFIGLSNEGSGEAIFKFYVRDNFNSQFQKEVSQ